jgi:hypothetical protein
MELRMEEIMAMEKIRMVEILMEEMDRSTPGMAPPAAFAIL